MLIWVLTQEYNLYDQYGEYFIAVFGNKPTVQQLLEKGVPAHSVEHVLNGGGRVGVEDDWYFLRSESIDAPKA